MANKDVIAMKEAKVKELADHIKDAKLVLLVDYRGTTVEADTKLRKNIREVNGELKVIKNNIIKRALDANNESGLDDVLEGPTAVVSAKEDYLQPLKAIYKFSKENENYKIKGGIIDGKVTKQDIATAKASSSIQTEEELQGLSDRLRKNGVDEGKIRMMENDVRRDNVSGNFV